MYIQLDEFSQNEQTHVNSTQKGIQCYQHPKRSALCPVLAITTSSDFYCYREVSPVSWSLYKKNHVVCTLLCPASFVLHFVNLPVFLQVAVVLSFLLVYNLYFINIPQFFYLIVDDICVVSILGLLQIVLLWTFLLILFHKTFIEHIVCARNCVWY